MSILISMQIDNVLYRVLCDIHIDVGVKIISSLIVEILEQQKSVATKLLMLLFYNSNLVALKYFFVPVKKIGIQDLRCMSSASRKMSGTCQV